MPISIRSFRVAHVPTDGLLGVKQHKIDHDLLGFERLAVAVGKRCHRRRNRRGNLGRGIRAQIGARISGWLRRGVVRGHLPRIHFDHRMQLPTEARHRVDAPLVADQARDVAVVPAHEQRALPGLGDNPVPGAAAFVAGIAHTLECDGLGRR